LCIYTYKYFSDGFSVHWEPPLIPNGDVLGYSIYWSSNPDADLAEWVWFILNSRNTNKPQFILVAKKF